MSEPDRLLQMYRIRAGLTQTGLAGLIGLTSRMILNWEAGTNLPRPGTLKNLIGLYVERGVFGDAKNTEEARILWEAVKNIHDSKNTSSSTLYPDFDQSWFTGLNESERLSGAVITEKAASNPFGSKSFQSVYQNLPLQLTGFVGRSYDIAQIKTLINKNHLVTLYGSGGAGKTRLGLRVAEELIPRFSDGVWFIQLAQLTEPAQIVIELARVFGVKATNKHTLMEALTGHLGGKQLLLIVDNCEHLIEASIAVIDSLRRACPLLKILVTSREVLNLAGEATYRVTGLSLPSLDQSISLSQIVQAEAVQLFLERTILTRPEFEITQQNKAAIIHICHQLNGLPLSLELAAAQVKGLAVAQVADRLKSSYHLLACGNRNLMPRQQTLQANLEWSYNLLTRPEQILLQRLTVFGGNWTVEAAEIICGGHYPHQSSLKSVPEFDVLETLLHLVSKSMVLEEEQNGISRYCLLETVKQFAREKLLEAQEEELLKNRHLDYFLQLARCAETAPGNGAEEFTWLKFLEKEYYNFQAALNFAINSSASEQLLLKGLQLSLIMFWFWLRRGFRNESREWLDILLELVPDQAPGDIDLTAGSDYLPGMPEVSLLRTRVLLFAGILARFQEDYSSASFYLEQSANYYIKNEPAKAARLLGVAGTLRQSRRTSLQVQV